MVTAVLPAYLVLGLHLSFAQYGLLDGIYTGATALTRLLGGWCADRFQARKLVAGLGYGLSAVAKVGLLVVTAPRRRSARCWRVDRTGKGLRTAPRDALIALSVDERDLGQAFGLHRAMDSTGAFLGPLAALGLLALAGIASYDSVFVGSLCAALIGLIVLVLFVDNRAGAAEVDAAPVRLGVAPLLRSRPSAGCAWWPRCSVWSRSATASSSWCCRTGTTCRCVAFPLLAVGTSLAFLLLAVPLGRLADRVGRWPVVVAGYACLLAVYMLLAFGSAPLALIVALYGAFYAATDGVLVALVLPFVPDDRKTTGLALLQTGQAVAYLLSSVLFGLLWTYVSVQVACLAAAAARRRCCCRAAPCCCGRSGSARMRAQDRDHRAGRRCC